VRGSRTMISRPPRSGEGSGDGASAPGSRAAVRSPCPSGVNAAKSVRPSGSAIATG
jgi:hypothetical protein